MKRINWTVLTILGVILAGLAIRAVAMEPKNIEVDWSYNVKQAKISTIAIGADNNFDPSGAAGAGILPYGHNIVGHAYTVRASGADIAFTISYATGTRSGNAPYGSASSVWGYNTPVFITTTSAITVLSSDTFRGMFYDYTINPRFTVTGITGGGSAYITLEYGEEKKRE